MNPYRYFYLWAAGLFAVSYAGVYFLAELGKPLSLLAALNIATLFLFGYDKKAAMTGQLRVPEKVILSLGLLGGTPAILFGMKLFRHKTKDRTFLPILVVVLAIQALLAAYVLR